MKSINAKESHINSYGVAFLKQIFERRMQKNPRYSLRAFSKSLGVSHSLLSQIFNNQRSLTHTTARNIAQKMNLSPKQEMLLAMKVNSSQQTSTNEWTELTLEQYALISEWQHFAVLSLTELPDFDTDPDYISKKLGISPLLAKTAVQRLIKLGYLGKNKSGKWIQMTPPFQVTNKVSTPATKKCNGQLIKKSLESLREDPINIRDHSGIVFALDPQHIPFAIERIRQFRRQLCAELEAFGSPKEVYALNVQLFPLSRSEKK